MANETLSVLQELALIYVKAQCLEGKSPEEVVELYRDAYSRMSKHNRELREAK